MTIFNWKLSNSGEINSLYENKNEYNDIFSKDLVKKLKNAEMIEDDATLLLKHKGVLYLQVK